MVNSANPFSRGTADSGASGPRLPFKEQLRRTGIRWHNNWQMNGPNITVILIVINIVIFAVQMLALLVPRVSAFLDSYGALQASTVLYRPWTLLTSGFMHAGLFHLLMNMLTLYIAGKDLERLLGHWPFLGFYLVSLLGSSLTFAVWYGPHAAVSAVGASGAIYGIFGGLLAVHNRMGDQAQSVLWFLFIFLALPIFFGGSIAWQAHLGGFIIGGLLSFVMIQGIPVLRSASIGKRMWIYGSALTVLLVIVWLVRFALAGAFA